MNAPLPVKCPDAIYRVRTSERPRVPASPLPPVPAKRLWRPGRASAGFRNLMTEGLMTMGKVLSRVATSNCHDHEEPGPVNDVIKAGPEPQAILTPLTEAAIFLVLTVDRGREEDVRDLLSDVSGLTRSVGFRIPNGGLTCVVGLGSQLWDRLFGNPRPAGLHVFRPLAGSRHTAVSTPGDLLFHIRAHRFDMCFELAQRLLERLAGRARVVDEVHGFKSFDERDLLGFVDGTENPAGSAAFAAVVIEGEDARVCRWELRFGAKVRT